jgi:hypothetical protein
MADPPLPRQLGRERLRRRGPAPGVSAISSDGIHFTPEPGVRYLGGDHRWWCRYRMGALAATGSTSPPSPGCGSFTWTLQSGVRLTGGTVGFHPAALLDPAGGMLLIFGGCLPRGVYTAASADGLSFAPLQLTNLAAELGR